MPRVTKAMLENYNDDLRRINSKLMDKVIMLEERVKWLGDFRSSNASTTIAMERISDALAHTILHIKER